MRHTKALLTLIASLLLCSYVSAQANFQQHQQHMQMINRTVQNQMHTDRQFMNMHLMSSMHNPSNKSSGKYKFNFVLLNGDTILNNKKISISFLEPLKKIVLKNKKEEQTFTPDQTKEVFVGKGKKAIRGIPHEDHWIFNTHSTSTTDFYAAFPDKGISYITHFRTKGGTLKELTNDDVQEIVKDHPKALEDAKNDRSGTALFRYFKDERWKK